MFSSIKRWVRRLTSARVSHPIVRPTTRKARLGMEVLEDRRLMAAGLLDLSFSGDGKTTMNFDPAMGNDIAHAVAIQQDGKIVVAGRADNTDYDWAIVRYNADGTLDDGSIFDSTPGDQFGTNGRVTLDWGGSEYATAVAIQPDGKILAAGRAFVGGTWDFALARWNADGSLDNGNLFTDSTPGDEFGTNGRATVDFSGDSDFATSLALQDNGRILVAGYAMVGADYDFAVARFNSNGSLDDGNFFTDSTLFDEFGTNGKALWHFGFGHDYARDIAIQSWDGKIVVAGQADMGADSDFAVVRFNTDGSRDDGTLNDLNPADEFGTNGLVTLDILGSNDSANAIAIQDWNHRIVAAGQAWNGADYDFALARWNEDGSLDNGNWFTDSSPFDSFNGDGKATVDFANGNDYAHDVVIDADRKILAVGQAEGATLNFGLARLNSAGNLDTSFSSDGMLMSTIGTDNDIARSVAVQSDGKYVVAGQAIVGADYDFAVARYENDQLQFSQAATAVGEASGGVLLTVERTGGSRGAISVDVSAINGTATQGTDYTLAPMTLDFADGETSKTFFLPVHNDALVEGDETVVLNLGNGVGNFSYGAAKTTTVTILDNGGPAVSPATNVTAQVVVIRTKPVRLGNGLYRQVVKLVNVGGQTLQGPLALVLNQLKGKVKLHKQAGVTKAVSPFGGAYAIVLPGGDNVLSAGEVATVKLLFKNPLHKKIKYSAQVLAGNGVL